MNKIISRHSKENSLVKKYMLHIVQECVTHCTGNIVSDGKIIILSNILLALLQNQM